MTRPEVSEHQIVAEWAEARQMLNDARFDHDSLPDAVCHLLSIFDEWKRSPEGPEHLRRVVDLDLERAKRVHPSYRRRADLAVPPEGPA